MEIGSTAQSMTVELCSQCHPFYTGKQKLVDTAGRVDRFRARAAKAEADAKAKESSSTETPERDSAAPTTEERLAEMKKSLEQKS